MKLEILEQKKNPLLKREEVLVSIEHTGARTPTRKELSKEMAVKLRSKESHIIVDKVFTVSGRASSRAKVSVYQKPEDIPKHKLEKSQRRLEKKKEETAPPAEKAEVKPEAKTEEVKEEEKPKEEAKEEKPEEEAKEPSKEEKPEEEAEKEEKK